MIRSNGFFNFFSTLIVGILTGVLAFTQPAFTGGTQSAPDNTKFSQTPHIQSALAEMAQAGEKPGACYQTGSVEKCAACCRDFMTACIDLVVPLCLQGDPAGTNSGIASRTKRTAVKVISTTAPGCAGASNRQRP